MPADAPALRRRSNMRTAFSIILSALLALGLIGVSRADELSDLNAMILRDPGNVELNLRYARLAEQKGELKQALSAYERVIVNSPMNHEAEEGFRRIVRKLQPEGTRVSLEFGGGWESNPARAARGGKSDWLALVRAELRDERRIGEVSWRTIGSAIGEFYREQGDAINYASAGAVTGPIWDVTPQFALHTAVGGGAALYGEHKLYEEAVAAFTLESGFWNGVQTGRLRIGFRRYDEFYGGSDGIYVDVSERFGFIGVLQKNDIVVAMPWFRWSDIAGTPLHLPLEETQPGRYWETGLRAEYFRPLAPWIMVGASMSVSYREFSDVTILKNGAEVSRRDRTYMPGVAVIFPKLLWEAADLRIDYRYEDNRSNVPFDTYVDHQITTSTIFRF
jgi:tetratricopeptide (TPR) repeat protein